MHSFAVRSIGLVYRLCLNTVHCTGWQHGTTTSYTYINPSMYKCMQRNAMRTFTQVNVVQVWAWIWVYRWHVVHTLCQKGHTLARPFFPNDRDILSSDRALSPCIHLNRLHFVILFHLFSFRIGVALLLLPLLQLLLLLWKWKLTFSSEKENFTLLLVRGHIEIFSQRATYVPTINS